MTKLPPVPWTRRDRIVFDATERVVVGAPTADVADMIVTLANSRVARTWYRVLRRLRREQS